MEDSKRGSFLAKKGHLRKKNIEKESLEKIYPGGTRRNLTGSQRIIEKKTRGENRRETIYLEVGFMDGENWRKTTSNSY